VHNNILTLLIYHLVFLLNLADIICTDADFSMFCDQLKKVEELEAALSVNECKLPESTSAMLLHTGLNYCSMMNSSHLLLHLFICLFMSFFVLLFHLEASWTMFAPTDDAIKTYINTTGAFPEDEELELLDQFIKFHLVPDSIIFRGDFNCTNLSLLMANGENSQIMCKIKGYNELEYFDLEAFGIKGEGNNINEAPYPIFTNKTDIKACNGAIHSIDQVLLYKKVNDTG
jgi:hypothetical protein